MSKQQLDQEKRPIPLRQRQRLHTRQTPNVRPKLRVLVLLLVLAIVVLGVISYGSYYWLNVNSHVLINDNEAFSFLLPALIILIIANMALLFVLYFLSRKKKSKRPTSTPINEAAWAISLLSNHFPPNSKQLDNSAVIGIRILEEPLTAQNITTIISSFTEFYAKCWLMAYRRFADLIEYTQTHNIRFSEEAGLVIGRISYNSPLNIDWKVDASVQGLAEAVATTIDGVAQVRQRLEKAELENRLKEQEIKRAAQKADQELQTVLLENEKVTLEIEKQRLELLEKRLDVQKKGIEYALEIASRTVDTLHPSADAETRAMAIQALLPNILQFQNGKGLELALPAPQNGKTERMEEK